MSGATATESLDAEIGHIGSIPVRNLWLLMLYASELFREVRRGDKVAVEDNPDDIPDLVAEILARLVERRLMRNLTFGYRPQKAVLGRVRGRIDLLQTERHQLLSRGMIACRFDNLTVNTPRNRFVRAALDSIAHFVHRPGTGTPLQRPFRQPETPRRFRRSTHPNRSQHRPMWAP